MSVPYAALPRHDGDKEVDIEGAYPSERCAPKMTAELDTGRPKLRREDLVIPGCVTRHEQDMIDLTSNFTETFTTEAGRRFVEKNSRISSVNDLRSAQSAQSSEIASLLIMWPTHSPLKWESFDGDFGSDINWIFALCYSVYSVYPTAEFLTRNDCTNHVVITGSLYPIEDSSKHTKVFSRVLIEVPSRYLQPKGEVLLAAKATVDAMHTEMRAEDSRRWEVRQKEMMKWIFPLLFVFIYLFFIYISICKAS